ncbi:cytochrome P450 [Irpex lacteus]|nr:cytochrome P450 [Irpex lacteus]
MLDAFDSGSLSWVYIASFVVAALYIRSRLLYSAYDSIPTVGHSSPLLSYITALQFYVNPNKFLEEGYSKYRDGIFKIPYLNSWHIVVSGPKLIDELRQAKDDELSFAEAVAESLQQRHTMGEESMVNPYHIPVVRGELTKNVNNVLPDVHDELEQCFPEIIPLNDEWTSFTAMEKILQIVARASGRVFVGIPVCRNKEYLDISIAYTMKVVIGGKLLGMLPWFLRGIAANVFTSRKESVDRVLKYVAPVIEERRKNMELYGKDWADKPNDLLQWLLDSPAGQAESVPDMAQRLLVLNFASIHTSSMTFATVLYRLAANPEYIHPLREEAAAVIADEGYTKTGMQKMRKADSFIKECQRLHSFNSLGMQRLALKDYVFKDGTFIPKGTFVSVAQRATHTERDYYENPYTFDPWRFSRIREEEGNATKQMATTASVDYVPFGLGKHACPGRFFAVAELKAMLAWLVLHYDVKMENEGVFPDPIYFQAQSPPNQTAKVLFRKRQT